MPAQAMNKGHRSFLRESTFYLFLCIFSVTKLKSNSLDYCEPVIILVVLVKLLWCSCFYYLYRQSVAMLCCYTAAVLCCCSAAVPCCCSATVLCCCSITVLCCSAAVLCYCSAAVLCCCSAAVLCCCGRPSGRRRSSGWSSSATPTTLSRRTRRA